VHRVRVHVLAYFLSVMNGMTVPTRVKKLIRLASSVNIFPAAVQTRVKGVSGSGVAASVRASRHSVGKSGSRGRSCCVTGMCP
jgi:hypothetical protein